MAASAEPPPVVPPDPGALESWLDYDARGVSARRQRLDTLVVPLLDQGAAAYASAGAWARRHWLLLFNLGNLILTLGILVSPALQPCERESHGALAPVDEAPPGRAKLDEC